MGASFLSLLEALAKMLNTTSDIMAPLGAYKELGKGLTDSVSSSVVREATVGWLAAAQVREGGSWGQCSSHSPTSPLPRSTLTCAPSARCRAMTSSV